MATKKVPESAHKPKQKPALSQEARENQIIAAAYDLVEERIRNGTASSQETTFFLKMGSTKEKLERENLKAENKLLEAKVEALQSAKDLKELYADALNAMKTYQGVKSTEEDIVD